MFVIRALRLLLRSIRPVRVSLASIAVSLDLLARIAKLRLQNDGLVLLDEELMRHPRKEDMTEISWDVRAAGGDQQDEEL